MSLARAFNGQAQACEKLGSPFMGQLCRLMAERLQPGGAVADRMLGWQGDISSAGHSVPLRFAGAMHGLVIDRVDPGLASVYPPHAATDDALWAEVTRVMVQHEARLMTWLDSPPQTNEVRRAVAMIAAASILRQRFDLPLVVSELGASAGLNLSFDRFALVMGGETYGDPDSAVRLEPDAAGVLPLSAPIEIIDRAGVDLRPIDARQDAGALRLLAYLWPDQPNRMRLTRAAIALCDHVPDAGDAGDWLATRLQQVRPGALHLVYHTIAWQYFPPETAAHAEAALAAAGARATPDAPLARLSMEADDTPGSAGLTLQVWDGGPRSGMITPLGRIDFHGRWIEFSG